MLSRPTWVEISLPQLAENYRIVRDHVGAGPAILAVVKADAYGHGLTEVANTLASAGADWFGVTSADEGIELRKVGIVQPILLLTGFWEGEQQALTEYDLVPAVYTDDQLIALESWGQQCGKVIRFHLKINTGMGRLGIHWQELDSFLLTFRKMKHVDMDGLFAQFSAAEDFTTGQTEEQASRFHDAEQTLARAGIQPRYCHQANSSAIVSRLDTWGNMVRPGLLLYGYQLPVRTPADSSASATHLPVCEILTFKSMVIAVKEVPAGISLGYGGRYITSRHSRIATIPAGYADGLDRRLSGRGQLIIRDKYAPIVGNISMDLTLVDVTEISPVSIGDEVLLIGRSGSCAVTAMDLSEMSGTIPYEILSGISKRVPRRYIH